MSTKDHCPETRAEAAYQELVQEYKDLANENADRVHSLWQRYAYAMDVLSYMMGCADVIAEERKLSEQEQALVDAADTIWEEYRQARDCPGPDMAVNKLIDGGCIRCGSNRILSISSKVSDLFSATMTTNGKEHQGYVPGGLNIGGGDYMEMTYCLHCGQIQDDFPLAKTDFDTEQK